ncbi:MAG: PIG-L family deacetylase, partial [Pseudonocardia sp.]
MGTIVSFQAHPDDESITTAATVAKAAAAGHRVVTVFATRGELGQPVPGVLADGEQLSLRRSAEVYESAA